MRSGVGIKIAETEIEKLRRLPENPEVGAESCGGRYNKSSFPKVDRAAKVASLSIRTMQIKMTNAVQTQRLTPHKKMTGRNSRPEHKKVSQARKRKSTVPVDTDTI